MSSRASASRSRLPSGVDRFEDGQSLGRSAVHLSFEGVQRPPPLSSSPSSSSSSSSSPTQSEAASVILASSGSLTGELESASRPSPSRPTGTSTTTPLLPFPVSFRSFAQELRCLLSTAWPVITANSLNNAMTIVDMIFIGYWVGLEGMAAAGISNSYFAMATSVLTGATEAVDRDCEVEKERIKHIAEEEDARRRLASSPSAASSSAMPSSATPLSASTPAASSKSIYETVLVERTKHLMQRGIFISITLCLPSMIALSLAGPALRDLFFQTPEVVDSAASYCDSLILGMLPLAAVAPLSRWLSTVGHVKVTLFIAVLANILNVGANAVLVDVSGFLGAPLATSTCRLLQLLMLSAYIYWRWRERPDQNSTRHPSSSPLDAGGVTALHQTGPHQDSVKQDFRQQLSTSSSNSSSSSSSSNTSIGSGTIAEQTNNVEDAEGKDRGDEEESNLMQHSGPAGTFPGTSMLGSAEIDSSPAGNGSASASQASPTHSTPPPPQKKVSKKREGPGAKLKRLKSSATRAWSVFRQYPLLLALGDTPALLRSLRSSMGLFGIILLEVWPYELITLMVGSAGNMPALCSHLVLQYLSTSALVGLPTGIAAAGRDRLSAALLSGRPRDAFQTVLVAAASSITYTLSVALMTLWARGSLGSLFNDSETLNEAVAELATVAAIYQTLDGFQAALGWLLRGVSRVYEDRVAFVNVFAWWVVGVPLSALLALTPQQTGVGIGLGMGVVGAWWGMIVAVSINAICFGAIFHGIDWAEASREARRMARAL